jgi:class 3 adenylate cyclase/tetratricopeptide (TPR) repeat protein
MARDIVEWLEGLGLGRYAQAFVDNEIDPQALPHITEEDLKEIGVALGARRKVLAAIAELGASGGLAAADARPGDRSAGAEAERRQLTVMFVDLVGSTELAAKLDPEDLRGVLRRYQDAVAGAITRYGGHVAKYLGDGVLAYFGWPQAQEDQAERAVHAGLEAISATNDLTAVGRRLAARVGIATGLVVVGDLAGETDAIAGETPNLAARLQALAQAGEVVIGPTTQRLVTGAFDVRDLGSHSLKGFADPVGAWRVVAARASESRFESTHATGLTPLVGRQQELALLRDRWRRARAGDGQVVLLSGDGGIGKSRLLVALGDEIREAPHIRIQFQCSPYHTDSAFHPFARQLERGAGFAASDDDATKLDKLATLIGGDELDCAALATLMALPTEARFGPIDLTPQQLKLRAIDALLRHLGDLATENPVLLIFEDLHWIDPSSQDLLNGMTNTLSETRLLALLTHRPGYQAPFLSAGNVTALTLTYLARGEIAEMVRAVAGQGVNEALLEQIVARTDGIPLFVEEMTKSVTEAGVDGSEVPETLQASLMSRLDRLGPAKEIAQIGAVIGRDFDYPLLERVAERERDELVTAIDRLVDALLVFQSGMPPEARYTFKHALVQDAAYDSLLRSRREVLHGRIAAALERDFPSVGENEPEILARHHAAAGSIEPAINYWRRAGERAAALSSGPEACHHFERSIALLETLPPGETRDLAELPLRLGHAWALQLTRGPADAELGRVYVRALELSDHVAEPEQRIAATFGVWRYNFWRNGPRASVPYSDELWSIGETSQNVSDRVLANYVKATTQFGLGNEVVGATNAKIAWELFKESTEGSLTYRLGHNQGISSLLVLSWSLWGLGRPSAARSTIEEALAQAQAMSEPLTLTIVRVIAAVLFELLGEQRPDNIEAGRAMAAEYGFPTWAGYADTCLGWQKHCAGETEEGLGLMQGGIEAWRAAGSKAFTTDRLGLYGRMCLEAGQLDRARQVLTEGEQLAEETGEKFWSTEIQRSLGALALAESNDRAVAEEHFRRALKSAEARGAIGFALRAAIDLAGLLGEEGRSAEAHETLSGIYSRFDAADDMSDLRRAKALLATL